MLLKENGKMGHSLLAKKRVRAKSFEIMNCNVSSVILESEKYVSGLQPKRKKRSYLEEPKDQEIVDIFSKTICSEFVAFFLILYSKRSTFCSDRLIITPLEVEMMTGLKELYWQTVPQVVRSKCLKTLTKHQISYQEGLFEVITTQATYIYDLTILEQNFLNNIKKFIPNIISAKKYQFMFSSLQPIIEITRIFFVSLLKIWQEDFMLKKLYFVVDEYFEFCKEFYIKLARDVRFMMTAIEVEMDRNFEFRSLVEKLSSNSVAQRLQLSYYVNRPLQRVSKVPLLFRTILKFTKLGTKKYEKCLNSLQMTEKLASICNEEVNKMYKCEEMLKLQQNLKFTDVPSFPLLKNCDRYLERRSWARRVKPGNEFRTARRERLELYLFNDLFMYAKVIGFAQPVVCDYCPRSALIMSCPNNGINILSAVEFTLTSNCRGEKSSLKVVFELQSECKYWVKSLKPQNALLEKCDTVQQVVVVAEFLKTRPEEIDLDIGDIVIVKEEESGWYRGERITDGKTGWFPISLAKIITSDRIKSFNSLLMEEEIRPMLAPKKYIAVEESSA